ncbi:MAG: hypothetical protein ABIO55_03475 [Ginsengibacter sp.]
MPKKSLFAIFLAALIYSCDTNEGLFGNSHSKKEAIANGATVVEYLPDKTIFTLLDGTKMQIDTAWTEESFTYHNGKRIMDSSDGYDFAVPVKNDSIENFTFIFSLLDTTNRMFTNPGPEEDGFCHLRPKKLLDEMKIVLEQKDTDTSKGWMNPSITDTVIFKKLQKVN